MVIVRRGEDGKFDAPVFDYLNAVFGADLERIDRYAPASANPELVKEVADMPGTGRAILERGRAEGRADAAKMRNAQRTTSTT